MIPVANRSLARTVLNRSFLAIAFALAACTSAPIFGKLPLLGDLGLVETQSKSSYARGNLNRIWAEPPGALIMLQRGASGDYEQLVGLENRTTLKGDNFLWLNANSGSAGQVNKGVDLKRLIARFGPVPSPFSKIDSNSISTGNDGLGAYFWQEYSAGPKTTCVFAMRRLGTGARSVPSGTRVLDLVLRNCVNGSVTDALAPILGSDSAYGTTTSASNISRLAGPRP